MSRKGKQRQKRRESRRCVLCWKEIRHPAESAVVGLTGYMICRSCLRAAKKVAAVETLKQEDMETAEGRPILTPQEIMAELDKRIIGQDSAKAAISIAFWKQQLKASGVTSVPRSTLLLHGPTGCGKTAIAREAALIAGLPFIHFDATTLSEAGYRGRDADEMVKDLFAATKDDKKAAYGVIFVDEFDKLSAQGGDQRVAYARGTQHSLLRLVEESELKIGNSFVNTENLLFIFGGAFSGIAEEKVRHRNPIGFGAQQICEEESPELETEDFIAYGMEPELMGRITQRVALEPLRREDMKRILLEAENSVFRQYQTFFLEQGIQLQLSSKRAEQLINEALSFGTGARGLQTAVENMMQPLLFRLAERRNAEVDTWTIEGSA